MDVGIGDFAVVGIVAVLLILALGFVSSAVIESQSLEDSFYGTATATNGNNNANGETFMLKFELPFTVLGVINMIAIAIIAGAVLVAIFKIPKAIQG